jgi:hypothetical protein
MGSWLGSRRRRRRLGLVVRQQQLGILWLIDWVAWVFLISEFDCSRREKDEEERIDGEIMDLVNNFIIIDYEIVARNKRKRTQGGVRFVLIAG